MSISLANWLAHLEALSKKSIALSIARGDAKFTPVIKVAKTLGLLPVQVPVITVAGTNGKGSCVALLSSLFRSAGYRVGTFTSPHLIDYRERIQINQRMVEESMLLQAFKAIEKVRGEAVIGYFAFTFLVSLWVFYHSNLDIIVLEVGIGGRHDVVNVVDAAIAVVTSIALDHTEVLGNSLASIALEKAGIMRPDKPCVWGATNVTQQAKQYAQSLHAPLFLYGKDFSINTIPSLNHSRNTITFTNKNKRLENLPTPNITYLPNAACALQAVQLLSPHFSVSEHAICTGLSNVVVPGRFQIIPGKVTTLLDVAHNPASAELLADNLKKHGYTRILAVIAISQTKDIPGILAPLSQIVDAWYLGQFELAQCAPATTLATYLDALSITRYTRFTNVCHAYRAAVKAAQPKDTVLVIGSFHTVGAIMQLIQRNP